MITKTPTVPTPELMTQPETAEYLRVAEHTLENWRYRKTGPRFIKAGGRVVYRRSDIDEWLDENTIGGDAA